MAKVREKQLQKRKQETLEAAIRLLMERGYANLNMDELAEEVGISKPTLYQYFKSKEELVAQALVHMMGKAEDHFPEDSESSALEQLEHFLRNILYARYKGQDMIGQVNMEVMRSIVHTYPYVKEHMLAMRNKLAQVVQKAQDKGEIDPAIPTWVVVGCIFSMQGVISNHFMKDDPQHSDEEMLQAIDSIVRMFKRSVSVQMPIPNT